MNRTRTWITLASFLASFAWLLAATISFSTGASWGTMAIVMPLAIPLAVTLTGFHAGLVASPELVAIVGAVLAGAVFADHCSPISDTTIVSAFSSDCDVMAHVRTQLPYALIAAFLATVLGYLPAGYGGCPLGGCSRLAGWRAGSLSAIGDSRWKTPPPSEHDEFL